MVTRTLSRHCIFGTRRRTSSAATLQIGCFNKRTAAIDPPRVNVALIDLGVLRIHDASLFARRRVLHESASEIYSNPFSNGATCSATSARSSTWPDRHPLACDGSTRRLSVHLELTAQLHERPTRFVQSGGFLGLCRVQTRAANGDAAAYEMSGRGQRADVELLGQPAQGRASLIGSDQLVDFGVGQKGLSHPK